MALSKLCKLLFLKGAQMESENNKDIINSEIVIEILKKNGIIITIEEAKNILETMDFLVNLSIDQLVTE
jgi:hypothetical protein